MTKAPRLPGLRPGGAAGIENGLERRLIPQPQPKSQELLRFRRQRQVEQIHTLRARVVFELLDQLDREYDLGADLDRQLARFSAIDPALLRAVGGDKFAALPVRVLEATS